MESANIALAALKRAKDAQKSSGSISWSAVIGKPSEFPPSAHTHSLNSLDTGGYDGEITIGEVTLTFDKGVLTAVSGG